MVAPIARQLRSVQPALSDFGLLVHRLVFGGLLLFGHGWGKMQNYAELKESFADPLGLGMHMSLLGAIFAEVVCSALVMVGLATRLAGLVVVFTFLVAAFLVHGNDPLFMPNPPGPAKEPALLYAAAFLTLVFLGPGRISLDHLLFGQPLRTDKY